MEIRKFGPKIPLFFIETTMLVSYTNRSIIRPFTIYIMLTAQQELVSRVPSSLASELASACLSALELELLVGNK